MLALFLVLVCGLGRQATPFETKRADGTRQETGARIALPDGREVLHGPYASFHRNGKSASKGEYERGLRTGKWEFRGEDGKMLARGRFERGLEEGAWVTFHPGTTQKESEGSYRQGLRSGQWTFWETDGSKRDEVSGEWNVSEEKDPEGVVRARGARFDMRKDGVWVHSWRNGAVRYLARFELGALRDFFFLHPDGTLDPDWLSADPSVVQLPEWAEPYLVEAAEALAPPAVSEAVRERVEAWLAAGSEAVDGELPREPRLLVAAALDRLRAAPLDTDEGLERARRLHGLLRELHGGVAWTWSPNEAAMLVRRWGSAWELLADATDAWEIDFDPRWRWLAADFEDSALMHPPGLEEARVNGFRFGARLGSPTTGQQILARAEDWLSAKQGDRGLWGEGREDLARSALALLALFGDGTLRRGDHQETLRRGVLALHERLEGRPQLDLRTHALVSWLLCELAASEPTSRARALAAEFTVRLLDRMDERGDFDPDPAIDALARVALAVAAATGQPPHAGQLERVVLAAQAKATAITHAEGAPRGAIAAVGAAGLVIAFSGKRIEESVLKELSTWLAENPPDASTSPVDSALGALAAFQLGQPAIGSWLRAIEGPLRARWQSDGSYATDPAADAIETTCLATLAAQCTTRWAPALPRR